MNHVKPSRHVALQIYHNHSNCLYKSKDDDDEEEEEEEKGPSQHPVFSTWERMILPNTAV